MTIVLRFVDGKGLIQERFFDIVHVRDTTSMTLYSAICDTLSSHKFSIQNLRGQGYDGASNMRGEWKGLQALFLKEFLHAYYIHCMAHRLQLALVTASREYQNLSLVVNAVDASCKHTDQLKDAQRKEIASKISLDELDTGKGANQIGTLQRTCDTRWSSHLKSMCSLIRLYGPTLEVLENIEKDGSGVSAKGDANVALRRMLSFEFTFILLLMKNIMGRTDMLCQTFQQKRLDIVNAMGMVEQTKNMLNELRQNGWDPFFTHVSEFCREHDIDVPVLCDQYTGERCSRKRHVVTNEHYYHFDVFNAAIDFQRKELGTRFDEKVVDLLKLSSALDPTDGYKAFDADVICNLARKYYYRDFSEQEVEALEFQLRHFHLDVCEHLLLKNLSSVAELCHGLAETGKSRHYHLVDKLIRLVLTLPVSTATGERVFSAMKIVKNRLRSSMSDEFLADNLSIYIEREISDSFSLYVILQAFNDGKERRVRLTM
ncbi:Zinc finger MYM-type protein 1 [Linum grandiflorum]